MGSAHKPKSTRARAARSVKSAPKPRRKPAPKSSATQRPDLGAIHHTLCEGIALVEVAHKINGSCDQCANTGIVLQLAIQKLVQGYDDFDKAETEIERLLERHGISWERAP
jgi:hypothetical protein